MWNKDTRAAKVVRFVSAVLIAVAAVVTVAPGICSAAEDVGDEVTERVAAFTDKITHGLVKLEYACVGRYQPPLY